MSLKRTITYPKIDKKFIDNLNKKNKFTLAFNNLSQRNITKSNSFKNNIKSLKNMHNNIEVFSSSNNKDFQNDNYLIKNDDTYMNNLIDNSKREDSMKNKIIKSNNKLKNKKNENINIFRNGTHDFLKENEINNEKSNNNNLDINNHKENKKKIICFLCERTYLKSSTISCEDNMHSYCEDCIKSYFEGIINKNIPSLKCPCVACNYNLSIDKLKTLIDDKDYKQLLNVKTLVKVEKNKISEKSKNKIKFYSRANILDLNSQNELMKIINDKKLLCPKCFNDIGFYETNTHFHKCLNCNYKICKYCYKEYTPTHLVSNEKDYCKAYCRNMNNFRNNYLKLFLRQLIFVIGIFIICLVAAFILPFSFCKYKLNINEKKNTNKYFKLLLSFIFSIIVMIIIIPFIIILFPYFPSFITFFDLNL